MFNLNNRTNFKIGLDRNISVHMFRSAVFFMIHHHCFVLFDQLKRYPRSTILAFKVKIILVAGLSGAKL